MEDYYHLQWTKSLLALTHFREKLEVDLYVDCTFFDPFVITWFGVCGTSVFQQPFHGIILLDWIGTQGESFSEYLLEPGMCQALD